MRIEPHTPEVPIYLHEQVRKKGVVFRWVCSVPMGNDNRPKVIHRGYPLVRLLLFYHCPLGQPRVGFQISESTWIRSVRILSSTYMSLVSVYFIEYLYRNWIQPFNVLRRLARESHNIFVFCHLYFDVKIIIKLA